ncbi:ABC transporter permease [Aminobacter sp. NyZ550]|jgi:peptide/nickel transport system permease protein|uniref:Peptide/nickel transport system permease protein n=1 Tax=Aminobacter ciceronei TaxID=150723 RepID=A0ABR6CCN3_9HYPH|nr:MULTISPECIES: ABC transporter permease [Aminobacter]WMC95884.1 ABC transporter permease [Aminobacter aminovorans]MBA8908975.1 peptide/nickel transport system permease protein [Aminobacter ciceronei]MBA9022775.1 peptide/nickel transport system permease protein [Aminobacter ciceronei]QOF70259.1 ABC transporter permease [Aminobacter sp. SR38]WAX97111.1 ABC transporter permease [Aminobacter sp. NyZ550]
MSQLVLRLKAFGNSELAWRFRNSPPVIFAAVALIALVFCAAAASLIAPHNPFDPATLNIMDARLPPAWIDGGSSTYLLGTDEQGRDILSTIFYGMRVSILVGIAAVAFSMTIGVALGLIAGYLGGWVDTVIMRLGDIQLSFPTIMIAFFIDGVAKIVMPIGMREEMRFYVVILAIGVADWVQFARTVRAATMIERRKDYVAAARISEVGNVRILLAHILPNTIGPVLVLATLGLGVAILTEAILSFLGLGMPPSQPSLGTLIRAGNDLLLSGEWWISLFPGAALVLLVLAVNIVGDWLRDVLNPRLR